MLAIETRGCVCGKKMVREYGMPEPAIQPPAGYVCQAWYCGGCGRRERENVPIYPQMSAFARWQLANQPVPVPTLIDPLDVLYPARSLRRALVEAAEEHRSDLCEEHDCPLCIVRATPTEDLPAYLDTLPGLRPALQVLA